MPVSRAKRKSRCRESSISTAAEVAGEALDGESGTVDQIGGKTEKAEQDGVGGKRDRAEDRAEVGEQSEGGDQRDGADKDVPVEAQEVPQSGAIPDLDLPPSITGRVSGER